jgi:hypothetical protein
LETVSTQCGRSHPCTFSLPWSSCVVCWITPITNCVYHVHSIVSLIKLLPTSCNDPYYLPSSNGEFSGQRLEERTGDRLTASTKRWKNKIGSRPEPYLRRRSRNSDCRKKKNEGRFRHEFSTTLRQISTTRLSSFPVLLVTDAGSEYACHS